MTASIYKQAQLVRITPAGEWYVAIPHPDKPGILAVDVNKNLTFAAEHTPETAPTTVGVAAVKPVVALNRFINLRLEFIPGMIEASAFNLLANALYQAIADVQQREPEPRNRLILLTLLEIQATLGRALHQALTAVPAREETPYIEHDFIAQGLQARLAMAGEEV
ncbi:MAG TPA: hypothetical protein PLD25_29760 [Chloroflexota bacterium]|nr:hypothetical protein [Chloroflexota bacterium]HUM67317.1 hypothetical protein [Chloroflexota bacterium]